MELFLSRCVTRVIAMGLFDVPGEFSTSYRLFLSALFSTALYHDP